MVYRFAPSLAQPHLRPQPAMASRRRPGSRAAAAKPLAARKSTKFSKALGPLRSFIGPTLLVGPAFAYADPMHLSDIKDANGQQLSVDDLRSLMPGAHITNMVPNGSTRKWVNDTNGSLNATSDNKGNMGSGGRSVQVARATGTWSVNDNGSYCVNLEWRALTENWCRFMFKVGDKYYGVTSLANGAAIATEFSIEK